MAHLFPVYPIHHDVGQLFTLECTIHPGTKLMCTLRLLRRACLDDFGGLSDLNAELARDEEDGAVLWEKM